MKVCRSRAQASPIADPEDGFLDPYTAASETPKKKKQDVYLKPLTSKIRSIGIFTFDIESKDGATQAAGFTRPFLVGFFDGENYVSFAASQKWQAHRSWTELHLDEGGCIDAFCRFLFADDKPDGHKDVKRYQKDRGWIYGHNAGKFDLLFILGWLLRNRDRYAFEISSVMSKIQRLDVWRKGHDPAEDGCWTFVDSVGNLPMSLEKVGETFCGNITDVDAKGRKYKLGKRKMDLDAPEWDERWAPYLKDDCRVLYHGLIAYQAMLFKLGGELGITAPATAMKLLRRRFQDDWIYIGKHFPVSADSPGCDGLCHSGDADEMGSPVECERSPCDGTCHGCLHDFIRLGYYGGRVEPIRKYGVFINSWDINSSYPASMRAPMPIGKPFVKYGLTWKECAKLREHFIGFIECDVEIPRECPVPPLPWRVPDGQRITVIQPDGTETVVPPGKLIFPSGELSGVWDYDELCLLLHPNVNGKIVKIKRTVWYPQKAIFVDFIDTLYRFRDKDDPTNYERGVIERSPVSEADRLAGKLGRILNEDEFGSALAEVCKLMMNSLYGKFGMRPERSGLVLVDVEAGPGAWPENGHPLFRSPSDEIQKIAVWEVDRMVDAPYIIPQISAHITALSRIRLFMGIIDVVASEGIAYYTDTDNVNCSTMMPESKKLGGWKFENPDDCIIEGTYVLPKLYQKKAHRRDCPYIQLFNPAIPYQHSRHNDPTAPTCPEGCAFVFHHSECTKKYVSHAKYADFILQKFNSDSTLRVGKDGKGTTKAGRTFTVNIHGVVTCKGCVATQHKMKGISIKAQTLDNWNRLLRRDKNDPVMGQTLSQHKRMLRKSAHVDVVPMTNLAEDREGKLVGPMLSPVVIKVKKTLASEYDKRQFLKSGATIPIFIRARPGPEIES